jgi:hypothetical protein
LTAAAWETIPSTYVVADKDAGLPQVVQEAMAAGKAGRVVSATDDVGVPTASVAGELTSVRSAGL